MCLDVLLALGIIYTLCYENTDKKGRESAATTTGQGIKQQIKCLRLSVRSLGTLQYTSGITVQYLENFNIWQPFGLGGVQ
jgi:hypothetical protein